MNLWAEFENQHAQKEAVGHKPTRRLTEQVVLSSLREWLLQDYALPYCRSLAAMRIYRRCYWIDGWGINTRTNNRDAGTGSNSGSEASQVLSPVLQPLALLSQALAQASKPISLHGIVLAPGGSKRKESKEGQRSAAGGEENAAAAPLKDTLVLPQESGIVRGSWLDISPALLKEIASSPAIFLLNPFGQAIFTHDDLLPLYQRKTAPTELCFLIPHQQTEMRLMSSSRIPAGAAALTALLRTDRWKAFLPQGEEATPFLDGVLGLLVTSMQQHFLWVQRIAFQLQVRPAVVETAPYTLIFATRSKDSLATMNDALCLHHRRLALQSHQGLLGEEWFAAQQQERFAEELQQLRQHILRQGKAQRVRRWPDLRLQLLPSCFGQFTLNDYDEVIIALLEQGDVRCEWRRRPGEEESQRVPGNEDTLLWR
jgi:hypothetical protein